MNKYTKSKIKEMVTRADDVEIYKFNQQDRYIQGIHTDNIKSTELGIEELPDEFTGIVQFMDEDDYENTILANSSIVADFAEWYGSKDAKVLVVALSYNN